MTDHDHIDLMTCGRDQPIDKRFCYRDYRAPYLETLQGVEGFLSDHGYIA